MTTRAVAQVDDWESEPFSGGYAGLRELADAEASAVVQSGPTKACLLNGAVVGILDGSIEDFEDASGTVYHAPSPALPLLAYMQERSDEVRAKYYTEDTPISDVDGTLSDGGFSGFIELSENVLSGDYYVVYHAGRSMAVAWVGNVGELLTDDEAFDRADDEVGIYEVRPVDIDPVEIPEPAGADDDSGGVAAGAATTTEASTTDGDASDTATAAEATDAAAPATDASESETGAAETTARAGPTDGEDDAATTAEAADATRASETDTDSESRTDTEPTDTVGTDTADDPTPATDDAGDGAAAEDEVTDESTATGAASRPRDDTSETDERGDEPRTDRSATQSETATAASAADPDDEPTEAPERTDESTSSAEAGRAPDRERARSTDVEDRTESATTRRSADPEPRSSASSGQSDARDRSDAAPSRATADASSTDASAPRTERTRDRSEGPTSDAATRDDGRTGSAAGRATERADEVATDDASGADEAGAPDALETRSIPSLDPARTTGGDAQTDGQASGPLGGTSGHTEPQEPADSRVEQTPDAGERGSRSAEASARASERRGRDATGATETATTDSREPAAQPRQEAAGARGGSSERVADLEAELEETEAELARVESDLAAIEEERDGLRADLDDARAERDGLRADLEDLREERDRLASERDELADERDDLQAQLDEKQDEIDRLRSQLQDLEDEFGIATDAEQRLGPGEALTQTNLFVRYESKGKATLEAAHDGNATREEVGENLGLESHTQFEADTVSVAGKPFHDFLRNTIQYRFVTWVVNDLLYEIQDTGKVAALQELYDAIPHIDRAELNGTVSTEYTEDGQERRSQESFDIVLRDRMGNPLMVANLNDSRQAATESMMSSLVTASSHVGESEDSLAASFLVTSSFFEPEALETASEATSGGLLSRDKRESFVKLSRKRGYHLCLAEAREGKFHLAVPEL